MNPQLRDDAEALESGSRDDAEVAKTDATPREEPMEQPVGRIFATIFFIRVITTEIYGEIYDIWVLLEKLFKHGFHYNKE